MWLLTTGCLISAFMTSLIATWLMRWISPKVGLIDKPAARKVHLVPTPLGGGVGIWCGVVPFALIAVLIGQFAKPSFAQPLFMVVFMGLAILGGLFGLIAFFIAYDWRWVLGAVLILANWPYTLFVIMPTNRQLKALSPVQADDSTRDLIRQWGLLHLVRVALGALATLEFLWALH